MYTHMAPFYDALTTDVPYEEMADYIEGLFLRFSGKKPKNLLELACGTGNMTLAMAKRGYAMLATDASAEMLSVATEKLANVSPRPFLVCQPMEKLSLHKPFDGVICCLDSVNYLPSPRHLRQAFANTGRYLKEGDLFIFDMNTKFKLKRLEQQVFVRETEEIMCVWQTEWHEKRRLAHFFLDFFLREKEETYQRFSEIHTERAHQICEIDRALAAGNMRRLAILGEQKQRPALPFDQRVYIIARKETTRG